MKNLIFTITPGGRYMKVKGSVHKFANGGEKNNDRFTFARFIQVAEELRDFILPSDRINVIEIGLNITTPFPPGDLLKNLISHKNKRFNLTTKTGQNYGEVAHSQYRIKIYDKGLHQGGENILRVEVHINKMQWLRKSFPNGLTWGDLQRPGTWVTFGQYLINTFPEVLYYDPTIDKATLNPSERTLIDEGYNPIYWENLTGDHKERQRKRFQDLIRRHGTKFNSITDLLKDELARVLPSEVAEIYQYAGLTKDTQERGKFDEVAESYPLLDCKNTLPPPQGRYCPVTGIDISVQRPDSKFLCTTGIRELIRTDPAGFERLRAERLSDRWYYDTVEVQIREIAHSIRNEFFNPRHNTRRAVAKILQHPTLFDVTRYIRKDCRILLEQ